MVCAEEITVEDSKSQVFWRGCNHVFHRACLKLASDQGISGCPRCSEEKEVQLLYPTQLEEEADERDKQGTEATIAETGDERGDQAAGEDEESAQSSEMSMGEDSEANPEKSTTQEDFGQPKQHEDLGQPKQPADWDAPVLTQTTPPGQVRTRKPPAQPKPRAKKAAGKAAAASSAVVRAAAPSEEAVVLAAIP